jgi:NAD(P)-dependent dehydrogenase (short-subunit alcohol dehydrogenase family)
MPLLGLGVWPVPTGAACVNAARWAFEGLTVSALVTGGATSGIGRAAPHELGRHGAEVVVPGRDAARGAVASTTTAAGGKARFAGADLSDPARLNELVEQAPSTFWSTMPGSPSSGLATISIIPGSGVLL